LLEKNMDSLSDIEYESFDHIEYSPFVVMKIDTANIEVSSLLDLSKDSAIAHISLSYNLYVEEESSTSYTTVSSTWSQMLTAINASGVVNSGTYTGEGIKVGILEAEGVCDTTHANLVDKNITIENSSSHISDHATKVTSVVSLMAPDAEYYVTYGNDAEALSWFVENGCDVINCSFGVLGGTSSSLDGYYMNDIDAVYDYYVETLFISIVVSAGNIDSTASNGDISSPGNAYNVITVGGVNRVSGSSSQLAYDSRACYRGVSEAKPTVSSVFSVKVSNFYKDNGTLATLSGTSFSAPQVTALIALLLEKDASYIVYPEKVTSTILASANTTYGYEPDWDYVHHDDKVGAGVVSWTRMMDGNASNAVHISNDSSNVEVLSRQVSLQSGDSIQIGLSWLIDTNAAPGVPTSVSQIYVTDYDLYLYDSNGNLVASSETADSSTEMIRYTATISGSYDIVVYQYGSIDDANDGDFMCMTYNISG